MDGGEPDVTGEKLLSCPCLWMGLEDCGIMVLPSFTEIFPTIIAILLTSQFAGAKIRDLQPVGVAKVIRANGKKTSNRTQKLWTLTLWDQKL